MDERPRYSDPELYDRLFPGARESSTLMDDALRQRTLASERFYVEEARRSGGRVLELGCGTGRPTIAIAQSGIEITGADLSKTMLDAARAKALAAAVNLQFVEADMRQFDLSGSFNAILITGNSLLHLLTTDDLRDCLTCVRRHLQPDGRLIFDISKWDLALLARDPGHRREVLRLSDPERGEITMEETTSYDAAAQIRYLRWYLSAPGAADFRTMDYCLRVIFPQELPLPLGTAGFRIEARFGEFTRESFQSSSPRQVCICS